MYEDQKQESDSELDLPSSICASTVLICITAFLITGMILYGWFG